ncbi:MAG: hypothetical protein WCH07_05755 [Deltaproteobacteria bacterium]|jgi:hypothetical protein
MKTYGWLSLMMIMAVMLMLIAFAGCGKKADPVPSQIVIPAEAGIK